MDRPSRGISFTQFRGDLDSAKLKFSLRLEDWRKHAEDWAWTWYRCRIMKEGAKGDYMDRVVVYAACVGGIRRGPPASFAWQYPANGSAQVCVWIKGRTVFATICLNSAKSSLPSLQAAIRRLLAWHNWD
jgi:hypothetical protein